MEIIHGWFADNSMKANATNYMPLEGYEKVCD